MRFLPGILSVTLIAFFLCSCGGEGELGSVDGVHITTDEYLAVFNNLPPDVQVSVLEPGGRMQLMNQVVRKRLLLTAWAEDPSVSEGWEELYRISMLSDSMFFRLGLSYNPELFLDSLASCGYSDFALRVVLLDDSTEAVELQSEWNLGNYSSSLPSLSAPWSLADGSSYRTFGGPVHRITTTFLPLLTMETGVTHVLPMYGEWCLCKLDLTEGEYISEEGIASIGFMNFVAGITEETLLSKGISSLAENFTLSGNRMVVTGVGSHEPVAVFGEDTLTVADFLDVVRKADPANSPGELSEEIAVFSFPEVFMSKEVTLWLYVKSVAQRYALAALAQREGVSIPEAALDYVRAESVVRRRVLEASIPDTAVVTAWFEENSEMFLLPERRSVLLAYTDSSTTIDPADITDFDDLPLYQTLTDSTGVMLPTPPQAMEIYGAQLGEAIFAADPGVFSGPITTEVELAAWFKVVEIVPPAVAPLENIFPQVEVLAASVMFSEGFENLISDLNTRYSATIDTAAVREIDLWGGIQ